jgi:Spy/CpxP family protein refolding chaperone
MSMRTILVCAVLALAACNPFAGPPREVPEAVPLPALLRAPNPMLGITQTYDQHAMIDSIRTLYRTQLRSMGRATRDNQDDMANLIQREVVDLRAVLTPEQQAIFDRHVAAAEGARGPTPGEIDH